MNTLIKKWIVPLAAALVIGTAAQPAAAQDIDKLDEIRQSGELRLPVMVGGAVSMSSGAKKLLMYSASKLCR